MSKSKLSLVWIAILLAMPVMALGAKGTAPTVSSISPATATAGGAGFVLTVAGSNFTLGSVVRWNGANLTTTYVSASQLQASIPSALISVAGTAQINVFTSGRGGGTSNGVAFTIAAGSTASTASTSPLAITTTSVSAGTVGTSYSATLAASGGTSPYTWSISSGALALGLALSTAGAISGTPTTSGTYSFAPQVADSASHTATYTYSMVISTAPLTIATTSVPAGTAGTAYGTALAASGGTPPHGWSVSGGALPPGLSVSSSGAISGTPTTSGSYSFTAQVADAASGTASYTYSLTVAAPTTTTSSCTSPSCYTTITSRPFSALNELGWKDINTSIVTDPTAPASPSNVGQAYYRAGFVEGSAPNNSYFVMSSLNYTQVYVSFYVKLSSNWQPDPVSINKIGFVWIHGNPSVVMTNYGAAFPLTPLVGLQNVPPGSFYLRQNVNTVTLANDGAWHHWEIQLIANTPGIGNGTVRWWLDGTKLGEYTDVQFSGVGQGNTWQYFYWNPTWGGNSGATVSQDMYMWMDDLYASGAP